MIEIQNIKTDNRDGIVNLLVDEKQQPFEIYFPKCTVLFSSTYEDIADEYAKLAYVGQKLSGLADNMNYEVIYPHEQNSVLFKITTKHLESLADLLLKLSYLYENDTQEEEGEYYYWDDVYQYIHDIENRECIPVCPEFISIYQEYVSKNEEEHNV